MFEDRAKKIDKLIQGWGLEPLAIMPLILLILLFVADAYDPSVVSAFLAMLIAVSPVWLPLFLGVILWITWIDYVRFIFWFSQDMVLLEIQLPQVVAKNPSSMEVFLSSLHNAGGEATFLARFWKGSYRAIWSLEIASNEGRVSYYIHMRRAFRNIVEARLYGQFPEAKIMEVDDYVSKIPFSIETHDLFGVEYAKSAVDALPIKTYIDYGLDKDPKEELQIDPITQILELLGQVGKGEYFWMQIILKPRRDETEWYGIKNKKHDHFYNNADKEIQGLLGKAAKRVGDLAHDEAAQKQALSRASALLSPIERERLERIERSMSKLIFETGIRVVYLAKKENFQGINAGGIIRYFDAFKGQKADVLYNAINPTRGMAIFDYPWQDFHDIRKRIIKKNIFFQYKNRAYFYVPYDQEPMFMSTEEIATLWHFPSAAVQTPGLNRVPSRRAEAPVNLPIG